MSFRSPFALSILMTLLLCSLAASGQQNLLLNPDADEGVEHWRLGGDAKVEDCGNGKCFVVRNGGSFHQDIVVKPSDMGKYAVLIGEGSRDRINADGSITGLPYLYGYMMGRSDPKGSRIYAYLQGQSMLARPSTSIEWVKMSGVFRIPEKTGAISFFLNQAERKDVPQDGSAPKFDHLGLYIFDTEKEAQEFVASRR